MKWLLFTVGKPALGYARSGAAEYLKRLERYTSCEHRLMRSGNAEEIGTLMGSRQAGVINIVLDERGWALTTAQFTKQVGQWQLDAVKGIHCFIGGAEGFTPVIREQADLVLKLSPFTLQHELAFVVFLEQLYRVHTILRGEPYHR